MIYEILLKYIFVDLDNKLYKMQGTYIKIMEVCFFCACLCSPSRGFVMGHSLAQVPSLLEYKRILFS